MIDLMSIGQRELFLIIIFQESLKNKVSLRLHRSRPRYSICLPGPLVARIQFSLQSQRRLSSET